MYGFERSHLETMKMKTIGFRTHHYVHMALKRKCAKDGTNQGDVIEKLLKDYVASELEDIIKELPGF